MVEIKQFEDFKAFKISDPTYTMHFAESVGQIPL